VFNVQHYKRPLQKTVLLLDVFIFVSSCRMHAFGAILIRQPAESHKIPGFSPWESFGQSPLKIKNFNKLRTFPELK
jgi:hypothetical protein